MSLGKKIGVNDPCWCGSGKKFKKCHRDRENQTRNNPHELAKEALAKFKREYCSHPEASRESCGKVIRAHTISKGFALGAIIESGHVYSKGTNFLDFIRNDGKLQVKKVGAKRASTFTGFCGKHDHALFEPIEQGNIGLDAKSIFLLSYRTIAHEMYQKEAELHTNKVMRDHGDKGFNLYDQIEFQYEMHERIRYVKMGVCETAISKAKYDAALCSGDLSQFKYVAIRLDDQLPAVTSGGRFPDFDFERNPLFDIHESYDDPPLTLINIVNDKDGAVASIAWFRDDPRLNALADNFLKIVALRGADFLVQLGTTSCDNTYYRPSWWEALDKKTQIALCEAAMSDVVTDLPRWNEAIATPINLGLNGNVTETVLHNGK